MPREINPDIDQLLAMLIQESSDSNCTFSITLTIGGTQISGNIISERTYYERLSKHILRTMPMVFPEPEPSSKPKPAVLLLCERARKLSDRTSIEYIHLSSVTIMQASGTSKRPKIPWRGKLASVDGFVLAHLDT